MKNLKPGERPNRQSLRKKGWDYTNEGAYFVTVNTRLGRPLFGTIVNGQMALNEVGRVAEKCWRAIPEHFPSVELDEFIIMPNHMHGVLNLCPVGAEERAVSLGDVVGAYKSAVSRILRRGGQLPARALPAGASAVWHRNYWDVIIHDAKALASIRRYIRNNPGNYDVVMNLGAPALLGNEKLFEMPKAGFLASRGAKKLHGNLPLKSGEAIISGFLSPLERAVFRAGLEHRRHLIWVKPWGLKEAELPPGQRQALNEGRLLIMSPFSDERDAPSARRAAWCNQYVLAHCDRMIVGHINPGGMLQCILSEADPEKEVLHL